MPELSLEFYIEVMQLENSVTSCWCVRMIL